jgi:ActR/RegA family two-component response regulator
LPVEIAARRTDRLALADGAELSAYTLGELQRVKADALGRIEKGFLAGLLEKSGQSVSAAARLSGIHRGQLQKMLARCGVRPRTAPPAAHALGSRTQPPTT